MRKHHLCIGLVVLLLTACRVSVNDTDVAQSVRSSFMDSASGALVDTRHFLGDLSSQFRTLATEVQVRFKQVQSGMESIQSGADQIQQGLGTTNSGSTKTE